MHQGSAAINWLAPSCKVMHKKGFSWYGETIGSHQVVSLIHMYTLLVTCPLVKVSEDQLNLLRQTITRACPLCLEIEKGTFPFVLAYIQTTVGKCSANKSLLLKCLKICFMGNQIRYWFVDFFLIFIIIPTDIECVRAIMVK